MSSSQLPLYGYWALVLGIAVQRLVELCRSRRNEAWLKARGAREVAPRHFMAMRCLHAVWLGGCIVEAAWRQQGPGLVISMVALVILVLGQSLRFAAMSALQERWTVHILTLPGVPPVTHGIYRYIRHPNYVGVVLELAALPAIFGGWITAVVCSIANGVILCIRIRAEEAALEAAGGYKQAFARTGRFFLCAPRKL
jgi:methyltransferase